MKNFFKYRLEKISSQLSELKLAGESLSRDALLYRVLPHFFLEIISKYLRVEVEGRERIPKRGPVILAPNHSGFSGFDAIILGHEIFKASGRIPRIMSHHLWFMNEKTALPATKMGFVEATTKNGNDLLRKKNAVILFPEGEYGNFKPSTKAYRLREFKRGFVRLAIANKAPIIPTLILGAEETHINLKELDLTKYLKGLVLPLPLNIIPLPAKWKIVFLDPIHLPYQSSAIEDSELMNELSEEIREKMQRQLNQELKKRKYIYFKKLRF